jgi:uncharacterized lipoprotein YbaY
MHCVSRTIKLAIACLVLASCQSVPRPDAGAHAAADAANATPAASIRGRAFYLERMSMAPGATLEVQLIADRSDAIRTATIADMSFADLKGPPFEFALPFDPARTETDMHYSLRAMLRNAQGQLEFVTATRVPVIPGSASVVEFRLVRADAR